MDILSNLGNGFGIALSPWNLLYATIGAFLGTAVGVLPGLGTVATIAILLPMTYQMNATSSIIMLAGIFYGAQYGGSTTSILLNIPGEASSVVTCIDGYQMARQGRAGVALGVSAIGSFLGGTVSIVGLSLVAPPLASIAIMFGPPEYFSLVLLGLMMAVYLSEESVLKGLIMAGIGIILGTMGHDPVVGTERFTFNLPELNDGLDFVTVAMGLFGISEVLLNMEETKIHSIFKSSLKGIFPTRHDWKQCYPSIARGSIIGFFIGVLPGGGAIISSFISYAVEKRVSRHPEQFGKGAIEGVAAPEAANNAASTSSFIPLMTLGIPGNATMAMILVALMIHGIRPGPFLLTEYPDLFWGTVASMYIGNIMLLVLNLPLIGLWVRMLKVPYHYMAMSIVVLCIIGAYSINYTIFDVGTMLFFGIFGFLLRKINFPSAPLILAMILGPVLERTLQQSLIASGGDILTFFQRPISLTLLTIGGLLILKPIILRLWKQIFSMKSNR